MGVKTMLNAALLKMLVHSIRYGHVEGIRLTIEKGVNVLHVDKKGRNLLQLAIKQDVATRMQMYVILADAGCDINHADLRGWSCVHYACASGADDVLLDLIRRGAAIAYNRYGFCGEMDLLFPRIVKAQSLLQHTEQLTHNQQVKLCWSIFAQQMEKLGYTLQTHASLRHAFKSPLKVSFTAPETHSPMDRLRIVDIHDADTPIWQQRSKTFRVPPGDVGSITLDAEVLSRPSVYHIYYEQHEPMPMELPPETLRALEDTLCVKDLDSGRTVSVKAANDLILKELESTKSRLQLAHVSNQDESSASSVEDMESLDSCSSVTLDPEWDDTLRAMPDQSVNHVGGGGGVYLCVAMLTVSIFVPRPTPTTTAAAAKSTGYDITISYTGHIGLTLEGIVEAKTHKVKIAVVCVTDSFAQLFPQVEAGDLLVSMNGTNTEYAGLKHTVWELKETRRPLVLQFRKQDDKPSGLRRVLRRKATALTV
ncbi:Aste57867_4448 [Aphanomyces stellatus]|uniref:Aste57867_4448 protein n=1 Tax=Aphanomyces stellatus TaxID=120398 RepID=A0A485KBS3_9STRA|nr:hypothetical protein As57867_004436 [Aphanomyces stellatus]VFT81559.1 Aste57867_4448 [Aphanomyces stellatus]